MLQIDDLNDPRVDATIGKEAADTLREETELINGVYDPLDLAAYRAGNLALINAPGTGVADDKVV